MEVAATRERSARRVTTGTLRWSMGALVRERPRPARDAPASGLAKLHNGDMAWGDRGMKPIYVPRANAAPRSERTIPTAATAAPTKTAGPMFDVPAAAMATPMRETERPNRATPNPAKARGSADEISMRGERPCQLFQAGSRSATRVANADVPTTVAPSICRARSWVTTFA